MKIRSLINEHNSTSNVLSLSINIDGIPLFRSSSRHLWPILASFENSDIFIIAIYCGDHKPNCVHEYLSDFIADWKEMKQTGFVYNEKQFDLETKCFSCDAPARPFLKNVINHTCERCCIHGTYEGRVVFNEDTEFPARQDDIFRQCGYDAVECWG